MVAPRPHQSSTPWRTIWLEPEAGAVDGDVVVEPAESGEVVGVVVAVVVAVLDVVRLEPVAASAAGDGAPAVAPGYEAADCWRDGFGVV